MALLDSTVRDEWGNGIAALGYRVTQYARVECIIILQEEVKCPPVIVVVDVSP